MSVYVWPVRTFSAMNYQWCWNLWQHSVPFFMDGVCTTNISVSYLINGICSNNILYQWCLQCKHIVPHLIVVLAPLTTFSFCSISTYQWSSYLEQLSEPNLINGASICTTDNILQHFWCKVFLAWTTFCTILISGVCTANNIQHNSWLMVFIPLATVCAILHL